MDLKDLDWGISKSDLLSGLTDEALGDGYIYGKCHFWGKECKAVFRNDGSQNIFNIIQFSFLDEVPGPGTEARDFKARLVILKELLGEPQEYININPSQLEALNNVYAELSYSSLPKIIWEVNGKLIVLRFQDYWGMIPDTYMVKK